MSENRDESFRKGNITSREYVESFGVYLDSAKAGVSPITGEIEITLNKYFSWEKPIKQLRNTPKYINWRKSVFERDRYTCKICGKVGGELNAHHIKYFAKYKALRYLLSNGITLCKQCHIDLHKGVVKLE
jgi:predicted restriction endonuclease